MKNRLVYRIIIYLIILGVIASITFAPNAGKEDPNIAYWIIGGALLLLWLVFVIVNEIMVKKHLKKDSHQ